MVLLQDALIYLTAMVIAVPLANRFGLGSVLGYLLAGMVIGPLLGIVGSETEDLQQIAEFGVVMMLFLVGLELEPAVLWKMRNKLIGLGGAQVLLSAVLIGVGAYFMAGLVWQSALAAGLVLALSSTAIVLQTLNEKGWMKTEGGQSMFSVLLFQDIAVIPMIAFLPFLAVMQTSHAEGEAGHEVAPNLISHLPIWGQMIAIVAVIAGIVVAGIYLSRPMFRYISFARLREIYTAAALLLIVVIAVVMASVGLSPALGAFLAGVVLSSSEYRHELESDLDPFKGLLLGLFFITIGAGVNFGLLASDPFRILVYALSLVVIKFVVLYVLALITKMPRQDRWLFSLGLAQAGEFAFVLLTLTLSEGVLARSTVELVTLVVAITMVLTPLLYLLFERVIAPRMQGELVMEADHIDSKGTVIIAGMGRFGQVVARLLINAGYESVMLDYDIDQIERFRKLGIRAYFGDATRPDLLHAAGIEEAKLFVASLEDKERQRETVAYVHKNYPHVKIAARAYDRGHYYELKEAGADYVEREVFEGALMLGRKAMEALGEHPYRAFETTNKFRGFDTKRMVMMQEYWSDDGMGEDTIKFAKRMLEEQEELMRQDREASKNLGRGWHNLPEPNPSSEE